MALNAHKGWRRYVKVVYFISSRSFHSVVQNAYLLVDNKPTVYIIYDLSIFPMNLLITEWFRPITFHWCWNDTELFYDKEII